MDSLNEVAGAQRKVAIFITRQRAELLTFWHAGSGYQIPAGSVEPGESWDDAARREAEEESGLQDLKLIASLGHRTLLMSEGKALILESAQLHTRPEGPSTPWQVGRTMVEVVEEDSGWSRIVYREFDLDSPPEAILQVARLEGWVPSAVLTNRQERAFYHFEAEAETPESWTHQGEPTHSFVLSWKPLDPSPELIEGQRQWLEEFKPTLH